MAVPFRLGIDVGTNSLGWCLLALDSDRRPNGILDLGVRIFSDGRHPKTGTSLGEERRLARQARRRRDRYIARRFRLMRLLVDHGLMPADPSERKTLEGLDPYALRAKGLDERLEAFELGRAVFHLNQRRGFKSNRRTERKNADAGVIKTGITELQRRIDQSKARTLGEYLHRRAQRGKWTRNRRQDLYVDRSMIEHEFDSLWASQERLGAPLSSSARDEIRDTLLFQRPLRPVRPGKCTLDPNDERAPWALPITQEFRMLQEIANLRVRELGVERKLSQEERSRLFESLRRRKELNFEQIRRHLKLPPDAHINLESERRERLKGAETNCTLSRKPLFGTAWWSFDADHQNHIVEYLLGEEDETKLADLAEREWSLSHEAALEIAAAPLVDGYSRIGRGALEKIVPLMRDRGMSYAEAALDAGFHHSDLRPRQQLERLPYYGKVLDRYTGASTGDPSDSDEARYGRIANPTVHIGLNQLRKLINAVIDAYGAPEQVVVELARDLKLSQDARQQIEREQTKNEKENDRRRTELRDVHGLPDSPDNMLRLRLHDELIAADPMSACCVYTGQCIARSQVFSEDVQVDHILPFAVSLDDGIANKVLCYREANQEKGKRSPHQVWGSEAERYEEILRRAENLPPNKRWRFDTDAMDRLRRDGDFLARQLTDTAYLSRVTRQYLQHICNPDQVYVIPGRLTSFLRRKWGLNKLLSVGEFKNRNDHRHHTIDAVVTAVTDRSLLQRVSTAAARSRHRLIEEMPPPWDGFRQEIQTRVEQVIVSHRPDHGVQRRLHKDSAYGLVEGPEAEEIGNLVYRKPIIGLTGSEVERIRDRSVRTRVAALIASHGGTASIRDALAAFARGTGVRRIRLLMQKKRFEAVRDRDGRTYKVFVPGENHHVGIFETAKGRWKGEGVSVFEANRPGLMTGGGSLDSARVHVLDLHKGDLVSLVHDGHSRIFRIVQLAPDNDRVVVAQHQEGGELQKRHDDQSDPFRWLFVSFGQLQERGASRVRIDILGRTHAVALPT